MANLAVTNGSPVVTCLANALDELSRLRRAIVDSDVDARSLQRRDAAASGRGGLGSSAAMCTLLTPASMRAWAQGGVRPQWGHGSSVTKRSAPLAAAPACRSATISACACPGGCVAPSPTTRPSFTSTAPTGGFGSVRPTAERAISIARRMCATSVMPRPHRRPGADADLVAQPLDSLGDSTRVQGFFTSIPQPAKPSTSLVATNALRERAIGGDLAVGLADRTACGAARGCYPSVSPSGIAIEGQDALGEQHTEGVFHCVGQIAPTLSAGQERDADPNLRLGDGGDEQGAQRLIIEPCDDCRAQGCRA